MILLINILMFLAGIVCLLKKSMKVNENKIVVGLSIKVLGVILIGSAFCGLAINPFDQVGLYSFTIGIPIFTLILLIVFCSKPIPSMDDEILTAESSIHADEPE